jgi:hypothetical protein
MGTEAKAREYVNRMINCKRILVVLRVLERPKGVYFLYQDVSKVATIDIAAPAMNTDNAQVM